MSLNLRNFRRSFFALLESQERYLAFVERRPNRETYSGEDIQHFNLLTKLVATSKQLCNCYYDALNDRELDEAWALIYANEAWGLLR